MIEFVERLRTAPPCEVEELLGISYSSLHKLVAAYEEHKKHKQGRPRLYSSFFEIVLVLTYLRHYPVDIFMAAIFSLPRSTYQRICAHMIDFLFLYLKPQLVFPDFNARWAHKREIFFPNVYYTWIVDGSEQPIVTSADSSINTLLYSAKKKQSSLTILLFVSMDGRIIFLSHSYGGSTNDLDIAAQEVQRYNNFSTKEHGLGDAGFNGTLSCSASPSLVQQLLIATI